MGERDEFEEYGQEIGHHGEDALRRPSLGALRRRGIYLLPNLFTTAALFFGFYAIVQAMNGRFEGSQFALFVAMSRDVLVGRFALLTRSVADSVLKTARPRQ